MSEENANLKQVKDQIETVKKEIAALREVEKLRTELATLRRQKQSLQLKARIPVLAISRLRVLFFALIATFVAFEGALAINAPSVVAGWAGVAFFLNLAGLVYTIYQRYFVPKESVKQ